MHEVRKNCVASLGPWFLVKNKSKHAWLDVQTRLFGNQFKKECNTRAKMSINFQDYINHSLHLTLTFTMQFKNIPKCNWFNIPRTLLSPSKTSLLVLVVSYTLLVVQGPSSLDTLTLCSRLLYSYVTKASDVYPILSRMSFSARPELNNFVLQAVLKEWAVFGFIPTSLHMARFDSAC